MFPRNNLCSIGDKYWYIIPIFDAITFIECRKSSPFLYVSTVLCILILLLFTKFFLLISTAFPCNISFVMFWLKLYPAFPSFSLFSSGDVRLYCLVRYSQIAKNASLGAKLSASVFLVSLNSLKFLYSSLTNKLFTLLACLPNSCFTVSVYSCY